MPKLDKKEGNTENCPTCKREMKCVMTNGGVKKDGTKFDGKLQWQSNGKAHYNYDESAGKFSCVQTTEKVNEAVRAIINQKIQLKDIDLDMGLLDKTLLVSKSACQFLMAIEYSVYEQLGQDANPAHVGEYVKIIAGKLLGVPNLQSILEEVGGSTE